MSNDMPGNPHYGKGHFATAVWTDPGLHASQLQGQHMRNMELMAVNQTEATLALAYEQRTANMIARAALLQNYGYDEDALEVEAIDKRLGGV